ncbi:deoxyribose-phosphate aldolase [Candidatus Palauibacter sp.]|uniref:deoxyribose-phosphate aldolase n=1 Tax=Candidatus Palauibacter sp. TaxID=3101350 RepID=UPI003AF248FD
MPKATERSIAPEDVATAAELPGAGSGGADVVPLRARNAGTPLDLDLIREQSANRSAIERRAATLGTRRSIKREWQAAWLLRAVTMIDLTTLSGDDTPGRVARLAAKARRPVRPDVLDALGAEDLGLRVASLCVYPTMVPAAVEALGDAGIPVCAVAAGFPAGLTPFAERVDEIHAAVEAGAREIDIVITRRHALTGDWGSLYDEVRVFREACGEAHLKTILATGELGSLRNVARASWTCMMAGADFIKTSTGKEKVNATLPVGLVMARAIRAYRQLSGFHVGLKPAGGVGKAKQALEWLTLMKEELGGPWLDQSLFRIGASSLLADIERQLEHWATGRYSAYHRHPLG